MWFLNTKTNKKWNISNKDLIKRLSNDEGYTIVETTMNIVDYTNLGWQQLKSYASDMGINTYSMNKAEILEALKELEGGDRSE